MSRSETIANGIQLYPAECMAVLATLEPDSVDSCVTDPPYHLTSIVKRFGAENAAPVKSGKTGAYKRASAGFMGKQWDGGEIAFEPETWAAVYRVLKPGGHLLAFGAPKNFGFMQVAMAKAGFEIRDCLSWNFGSGFPKSHNISKVLDAKKERCACPSDLRYVRDNLDAADPLSSNAQPDVFANLSATTPIPDDDGARSEAANDTMRDVREDAASTSIAAKTKHGGLLQPILSSEGPRGASDPVREQREGQAEPRQGHPGRGKSSMEGRRNLSEAPRQLREREVCAMPAGTDNDGETGRLRDGASASDGALDRSAAGQNRMRTSSESSAVGKRPNEFGTMALQPQSQKRGAWDHCGRCGKPIIPDGLGTALKPAMELIILARKPLIGTVAENVLTHGTGALNIDGCRVGTEEDTERPAASKSSKGCPGGAYGNHLAQGRPMVTTSGGSPLGRWPANVLHDGSDEVVGAFPESGPGPGNVHSAKENGGGVFGGGRMGVENIFKDSGSAARFFYTAKADSDDRLGSKHPTVKPLDLMQWLVRLVTPKGGLVLDPFAGTGTTGEAAFREGMRAILIEREAEYQNDIRRRMKLVLGGPDERKRESIKARGQTQSAGPLFAEIWNEPFVERS